MNYSMRPIPIKRVKHLYKVASDGRVYSSISNRFLKNHIDKHGYAYVHIENRLLAVNVHRFVHRLVAEAFIENSDSKSQVDHIDGNRLNNDYSNLRWVTPGENREHMIVRAKKHGNKRFMKETDVREARQLSKNNVPIYEIANMLGVKDNVIRNIVNGKTYVGWGL